MSTWRTITLRADGGYPPPAEREGAGMDTVYFVEATSGTRTWARGYPLSTDDPAQAAARDWVATAQAAVRAVEATAAAVGDGALAALVRLALPAGGTLRGSPPDTVVETTGTAAGVSQALRTVRSGGHVVLAARPLEATTPLATYRDVHYRQVRLTAVSWGGDVGQPAPAEHLVSWTLAHLGAVEPGQPAPPGPWHRLTGGGTW
jgi:hypothetical protein